MDCDAFFGMLNSRSPRSGEPPWYSLLKEYRGFVDEPHLKERPEAALVATTPQRLAISHLPRTVAIATSSWVSRPARSSTGDKGASTCGGTPTPSTTVPFHV